VIDTIVFIHSDQPLIDRGWTTGSVEHELRRLGLAMQHVKADDQKSLSDRLAELASHSLVWPVSYTIGSDVDGPLLVDFLDSLGVPYIGPNAASLVLNSKIVFKQRLLAAGFRTPAYQLLDLESDLSVGPPCVLKTEFTCNSQGVTLIADVLQLEPIANDFRKYEQRLFVESWERQTEYTIAYLPTPRDSLVAVMEMIPLKGHWYVDREVKADNMYVRFETPDAKIYDALSELTKRLVGSFDIDGHFRLDIIENDLGELFVIDINFLPGMNNDSGQRSYFPVALELTYGLNFHTVVCHILEHAAHQARRTFSDEAAAAIGSGVAG
jgi:D-alanine-D-alanine ligase-like ATP-grasp enzyme